MMQMETKDDQARGYGLAEVIVGIIASPVATMREINQGSFLRLSLIVFLLVTLVASMSTALTDVEMAALLGGPWAVFAVMIVSSVLLLCTQAGMCFGMARLFGVRGSFLSLLALLALANVPSLFMAPLVLFRFVPGMAGVVLYNLGLLVPLIWGIILGIIAVRETFQVSTVRALLIYCLSMLLFLVLGVVLIIVFVALGFI